MGGAMRGRSYEDMGGLKGAYAASSNYCMVLSARAVTFLPSMKGSHMTGIPTTFQGAKRTKLKMVEKLLLALMVIYTVWVARVTGDCGKPPILENGSPTDRFISRTSFPVGGRVFYKCYPGYTFKEGSSRSVSCKKDSTWSSLQAVCEPRSCGNPGEIMNGYYTVTEATFGQRVDFYCEQGYMLVGRAFRVCKAGGWDGQVPTCESIRCDDLPPILNGRAPFPMYAENWEYGMVAKYSCTGDYSLIGAEELLCTETGKWDKDPPTCKVVRCHRPKLIVNGQIVSGFGPTYKYRDAITYTCIKGYEMVGSSVIVCSDNNTFVPPPPMCKPRICDKPPDLEYGSSRYISQTSFRVGSRVFYRCNMGYVFKEGGSRSVTCRYDSTWTPLQATCEPRNCGNPGEILDGYFEAPDNSLGSKVIFYCDKGYRLVGRDHRVCTADGWDGQVPTCKSVTCADLPLISKGIAPSPPNGDHWKHGMIAKYSCHNGNSLIGAEKLVCTENGEWDKDPPTCKVVRCIRPESFAHSRIVAGFGPIYQYQETITFRCNKGYEMVGNSIIQCSENNKFVPPPPTCRLPVRCNDLPPIHNGRAPRPPYGGHWKYGMVAKYSCIGEYSLIGAADLVCTETGKWDKAPPTCEANGQIVAGFGPTYKHQETITYKCNEGYEMVGYSVIECTENNTFVPSPPTCKLSMDCGNPEEILNGFYEAPNTKLGSKAIFYCEEGYRMVGRNYQWCTSSGWVGQVPACEFAGCQSPELPPNGHIVAGFGPTYKYRETITYSCNAGYEMDGNSVIECSENNIFVPPPPICRPRSCGKVPQLENGSPTEELISQTSFDVGTEVTYSCYTGYTLKDGSSRSVTCQMDSTWTPLQAICEPINCGYPGDIVNGYYKASNTTVGNRVTFYCHIGYDMVGRDYRECTTEGWDGQVPSCEPINCGHPGDIVNGYYKAQNTTVGNRVTFYCDIGYKMVGRDYRECTAEGWDGQVPSCEIINCGHPGDIVNGYYKAQNMTVGNKVTFHCDIGYNMVGKDYRECTAEGWDGQVPSCEPINCGHPGDIVNGYYKAQNTTVGNRVTFYCDIGYKMVGRDYRECTAEGWDGQVPSCEPINCGHPGDIVNGYYKAQNTTVGNRVTFYCDIGYNMVGRDYRECTAEGWDGQVPSCEPINCGHPGDIVNGYYKAQNTTVGNRVTFYCDIGYKMVGRDYRECTAEGWDGQVPSCEIINCGHPGDIVNGYYKAQNMTVGNKVTFHCDIGYNMVGKDYRECTAEGWDGQVPSCEPINCGHPGDIVNGYYKAQNTTVGNRVTFYCDIGYKMAGRDYRECTAEGWDGQVPSCEPINCGHPGDIVNGYYKAQNTTVGNRVTFYCDIGYNMVGRDYRECTAEGWDGQVPACEPINCGHPGNIVNGYYKAPNTTAGNKFIFYCDNGYKLVGRDYRECTTEGWDGQVPSCEPINCGHPGDIVNGYYKAQNTTVGNRVTFYCDIGYKMVGRDYRECTAEGWDGQVPSCETINCGHPGDIVNGYYKAQNTTVGNRVTFYCDIGYKMVGRDYRECTAEGWDGQVPSCEPINCGHPGDIVNGYYKAQNTTVGNRVTFYCDIGYNMVGRDYRECTAEGWDGQVPSCEPINCGHPGNIVNGYYKAPNTTAGNKFIFYCDNGYKLVGRDYRECTTEGWDGQVPSCEPINCGHPGDIVNGYSQAPNVTVGNTVTFYCDIGYNMVGRDYRECTAEGWDGQVPSCELINCGHPGDIVNGYYKATNTTVGNKVTFYCDIGYNMVGRDYRQCTAEGWDGQVPFCEPINCGHPGDIVNGYYQTPNSTAGNKIIFYCDIGYKMVGRDYRECTAEGWDGQVPSCEPINCGHPGDIVNGYYKAPNTTVGNKVTFYCDIGCKMVGRDYRECTAEGWDGQVPSCEPLNCGHPGEIVNGYYKAPNTTVGSKVTFYCDIGYKMVGRGYRQCTADGWDGPVPFCESINCGNPGDIVNGYYKARNTTAGNQVTFHCDIGYNIVGRAYRQCTTQGWDGPVPLCEPPRGHLRTAVVLAMLDKGSLLQETELYKGSSRQWHLEVEMFPIQRNVSNSAKCCISVKRIILGIAVCLGLMFSAMHCYRKQLANKRQYYVANNIAMSPQIVSYSDGSFNDSV